MKSLTWKSAAVWAARIAGGVAFCGLIVLACWAFPFGGLTLSNSMLDAALDDDDDDLDD